MKTKSLIVAMATMGLIGISQAEEGKKDRPQRKLPPEIIEKFDKDGDGELNEDERKAAREAHGDRMKAWRKGMIEKFDKDGDGKLNEEESKAARAEGKARMLKRFDKDGDGTLNDDEKAEMRKEMNHRPGMKKRPHQKDGEGKKTEDDAEAPGAGEN